MKEKITVTPETKITEILTAYPWLPEELVKIDPRARLMDTFAGRMLIRKSRVADAARLTGHTEEELLRRLAEVVEKRKE